MRITSNTQCYYPLVGRPVHQVHTPPAMTQLLDVARKSGLKIQSGQEMGDAQLEFQMRHLALWRDETII